MRGLLGRVPPVVRFGAVGLSGTLPNLFIIWLISDVLGGNYILALVVGAQVGVAWNFVLTDTIVFPRRRERSFWGRAWRFFILGNLDLVARLPLTVMLVEWAGFAPVPAAAIVIAVIFAVKWFFASRIIWKSPSR